MIDVTCHLWPINFCPSQPKNVLKGCNIFGGIEQLLEWSLWGFWRVWWLKYETTKRNKCIYAVWPDWIQKKLIWYGAEGERKKKKGADRGGRARSTVPLQLVVGLSTRSNIDTRLDLLLVKHTQRIRISHHQGAIWGSALYTRRKKKSDWFPPFRNF